MASSALELGGLWTATNFPCNGEADSLLLGVEQKLKVLSASSTTQTACVLRGRVLWTGTLSSQRITASSLPVSLDVTVHLAGDDDEVGTVSIVAPDRMELRFADVVVVMTRGDAAVSDAGGADEAAESRMKPSAASSSDPSDWFCMNVLDSCTCVLMPGAGPASCGSTTFHCS